MLSLSVGHWLPLLIDIALKSALVSALALAALVALRRAPAATRHLALLAGLGVLLGLPALMLLLPRQALPRPAPAMPALVSAAPPAPPAPMEQASDLPADAAPPASAAALPPPAPLPPSPAAPAPPPFEPAWLALGWLLGALTCAGRVLAAQMRVWRLTRRCPPLPLTAPEATGFAALKNGPAGTPPMVWGWPRATLLLPPESAAWPQDRLRAVLLHEAAHVRRRDWLTQTLTQAACALYWFNPLVWLLAARLHSEAERAADDAVLLAGVPPADYASDLLAVARALSANGRQRRASMAAVTMARRSPVRGRLEAILDANRPRHRLTRRSALFAFAVALIVAAPLAALRPAARADEAPAGQAAPAPGVPTEADVAKVERHLRELKQARAEYTAAHPNTLTAAQIAVVDRLLELLPLMYASKKFDADQTAQYHSARAEAKKPHNKQERQAIWQTIFGYEKSQRDPLLAKQDRARDRRFTHLQEGVNRLPAEQVARETKMYATDKAVAVDETQIEVMRTENALGYSLYVNVPEEANSGFGMERRGWMSRADWVHVVLLERKMGQRKRLSEADIASLVAILRERPKAPSVAPVVVMTVLHSLTNASPPQRREIREAVTPFLTSRSKWDRISAQRVLRMLGASAATPPPAPKAPAAPPPHTQPIQQADQTGVPPMTPRITLKPMLLKVAAFTALAAGLTPPAAQATLPAPAPEPAPSALAAGGRHWETIVLRHTTLGTVRALTGWGRGGTLPAGVSRVFFLESNGSVLFQATEAGSVHMREAVRAIEAAPQPVQVSIAAATLTATEMNDPSLHFDTLPADGSGAMGGTPQGSVQAATGGTAAFLAALTAEEGKVFQSSVLTTSGDREATVSLPDGDAAADIGVTARPSGDGSFALQVRLTGLGVTLAGGAQAITVRRTLKKGETLVLVNPIPRVRAAKGHYLLLFVTPVLGAGPDPAPRHM